MELLFLMKLMKSVFQHICHQMIWIGNHHLNEILIVRILLLNEVERFLEVIPDGILKIISVIEMTSEQKYAEYRSLSNRRKESDKESQEA